MEVVKTVVGSLVTVVHNTAMKLYTSSIAHHHIDSDSHMSAKNRLVSGE